MAQAPLHSVVVAPAPADAASPSKGGAGERDVARLPMFGWALFVSGMLLLGSYTTTARLVEIAGDGSQPVPVPIAIFVIEALKFLISAGRYVNQVGSLDAALQAVRGLRWQHIYPYGVPGLLYMLNNNIEVYVLKFMDPASFRLINNCKIVTTAVAFRIVMQKVISKQQTLALSLLLVGALLSSLSRTDDTTSGELFVTFTGLVVTGFYAVNSALASVTNEFMMKRGVGSDYSIHLQNCILYSWGMLFNILGAWGAVRTMGLGGFTSGSQFSLWLLFILNGAVHGLVISYMMKYLSSIWKLFMSTASALVAAVLQMLLLGASTLPTPFMGSAVLVSTAIYLYNSPGVLCAAEEAPKSKADQ